MREEPTRPFQIVGSDFFSYGNREYLAYVDRASGWVSVICFNEIGVSTKEMIPYVRKLFVEFGIPEKFESDQGSQFGSGEFQSFLNQWGVEWTPSSPHYPQSNGLAESSVKKLKNLIAKIVDTEGRLVIASLDKGLLELRNTPGSNGLSPAQMVFGQDLRSVLPSIRSSLLKENKRNYYNQNSRPLMELKVGSQVRIQDEDTKRWNKIGTIIKVGQHRKYLMELSNGRRIRRNRKFIRLFEEVRTPPIKTVEGGQGNRKRVTFEDEAGGPRRDGSGSSDDVKGRVVGTEKNRRNKGRVDYKKLAGL